MYHLSNSCGNSNGSVEGICTIWEYLWERSRRHTVLRWFRCAPKCAVTAFCRGFDDSIYCWNSISGCPHKCQDFKEPEPSGLANRLDGKIKFPGGTTARWKVNFALIFSKFLIFSKVQTGHIFQADIKLFPGRKVFHSFLSLYLSEFLQGWENDNALLRDNLKSHIFDMLGQFCIHMYVCCMIKLQSFNFASLHSFFSWYLHFCWQFLPFLENVCSTLFFLCFSVSWPKRSTNNCPKYAPYCTANDVAK